MERVFLTILVAVLCASVRAGPIQVSYNSASCARTCTDSNKFGYVPGQTYKYQYDTTIKSMVQGASEDHASIHMSAAVRVEALSKCELSVQLEDVSLTEYDPLTATMKDLVSEFKAEMEKFPIRLSYQDGTVAELCLSGTEQVWVLNAKRGLISMIQNSMEDFRKNHTASETDVSGVCDTVYSTESQGWYSTLVRKSKNLLGCTDRHGYNTAFQGIPYTSDSDIQSLPLLKSDHNCVHEIDKKSKILKSVKCEERHTFRPFSSGDSGAVTMNTQTLTLLKTTTGTRPAAPILDRVSLKFDHVNNPDDSNWKRKDITRKLLEICEKTKDGATPETPRLFTDLVYLMKLADTDTISDMYKVLSDDKICPDNMYRTRKFFLDALPVAGTTASLHLITELITSKVVTGIEADMWLTSLAFIKNPTKDMLWETKPLINMDENNEKAMLSVGTLVHSYCHHHGNCENDDMVKAIVLAFVNKMVKGCKVSGSDMKTTLMALRGLGNAGYATSAIPQLEVCMQVSSNPIEIRLSAIEAFRRMPCNSDRSGLMAVLQNTEEDSEVRIAAYKVLMECPSEKVLNIVRNTLAREEVNQVGSYIWTHLTNLMETSDRHKQDIRALLEDEKFKKEFDLDQRKFSRNYEKSIFIEKINTGAKLEGDLIWSSKSFLPRSAMMNVTVDLFGHSVNMFEVGGRAEGLEYFLESFFGPNGYFGQETGKPGTSDMVPKGIKGEKIDKIDKRFSAQLAELRGSMYMRVFGNELRYMNFIGLNDIVQGSNINILDMLMKMADENDVSYSHSTMFLDTSFIVPTSSGFPLNLTVNGTATVDLKMQGKVDFRNMDVHGLIQPSAAVDISSMMSVDAFVTKSGVKMVSTLHTSTSMQGKLRVDKDGSLSVEYETPKPRMEIIDVKSSFFTVHRDMEIEQKMITDNRQTHFLCSPQQLVTITGLELCAEVSYPNASMKAAAPYFPMTGPISAGVYLYKRDTHTMYKMAAKSVHNKETNLLHFEVDTPGSRIDRRIELDFTLNKKDLALGASLTSPWAKASMLGEITMGKSSYGISGKLNTDGKTPYSFKAQLDSDESGDNIVFSPSLEILTPKSEPVVLKGFISNKSWKQLDFQYEISGMTKSPVTAKATIHNKPNLIGLESSVELSKKETYTADVSINIQTYKKKSLYKPLISVRTPDAEIMAFGGTMSYIYGKGVDMNLVLDKLTDKKVSLKGKAMQVSRKRRTLYNTKLSFESSPMDFDLNAKIDNRNFVTIGTDIDLAYVVRKIARDKLKLVSKITNLSSSSLTKLKGNLNFESAKNPEVNVKLAGEVDHNKKHTEIVGDMWYGPDLKDEEKHVDLRLEMNRQIKSLLDAQADLQTRLRFPALGLSVMIKGAHSHDSHNLNSNLTAKFGKGQPFETSLRIKDKTEKLVRLETEYSVSFEGSNIVLDHSLEQTSPVAYQSKLNIRTKKDQENTIVTDFKLDGSRSSVNSDMKFEGYSPMNLQGEVSFEPTAFITSLSFERDSKKYSGSLTSYTQMGKSSSVTLDLLHPDRHIVFFVNGQKDDEVFSGNAKLQLNKAEIYSVNGWFESPTAEKVNGSISLSYPSRTLTLNAYHVQGSKYLTHADFQWAQGAVLSAESTLDILENEIIANTKIATPFEVIPQAALIVTHKHDSEEYKTTSDLTWGKDDMISVESVIKKPISIKTLVSTIRVTTSLKSIKRVMVDVNHKLSGSLASWAKVTVNSQFVEAQAILQNTSKGRKVGFLGTVDLKTSFQYMKKGNIEMSHTNDGLTFNTGITASRNRKVYTLTSEVTHQPTKTDYASSGILSAATPDGNYKASWEHRHSRTNVATLLKSSWDKDREVTIRLSSSFDSSFSATVDLQSPFDVAKDAKFEVSFIRQTGALDSKASLIVNGKKMGSTEIGYNKGDANAAAGIAVVIPDLDVDSKLEMELTNPVDGTLAAKMNIIVTPEITMSLEGTQKITMGNSIVHTIVLWKSSFPGYEKMKLSYEVLADDHLATVTQLEYNTDKVIRLETRFLLDSLDNIVAAVNLTTPFEQLQKLQCGFNFQGNLDSLASDAFIEIQPIFDRTSAQLSWSTLSNLRAGLTIKMPIQGYEYFKADLTGKFGDASSAMVLKIEYKPGDFLQYEMNHLITDSELTFSAKGSSPFGIVSFRHTGLLQDFSCTASFETADRKRYGISVDVLNTEKIVGSMTISSFGRRDIIVSFTHSGVGTGFSTHAEIQHNRKNTFVSDLNFNNRDKLNLDMSLMLRTQLISDTDEYNGKLSLNGVLDNFILHSEYSSTELGKSELDMTIDLTNEKKGSFAIKSPQVKDIQASFNHFQQEGFLQSSVDFVFDNENIIGAQVTLNAKQAITLEANMHNPWTKDTNVLARIDGNLDHFVLRAGGSYGAEKADVTATVHVDGSLANQQSEVTVNIQSLGDFRVQLQTSHKDKTAAVLSVSTPFKNFAKLRTTFDLSYGEPKSLHFDYTFIDKTSVLDASFSHDGKYSGQLSIRSHIIPVISMSFDHEGNLQNFKSHAEYSIDDKKSRADVIFSGISRYSGLLTITSHLIDDFSVGFEHSGSIRNFKSHGEYSYGYEKREIDWSFDLESKVDISMRYKCPEHGMSTAVYRHSGTLDDFNCHVELTSMGDQWTGDLRARTKDNVYISVNLKPASSSIYKDVIMTFSHNAMMAGRNAQNFRTHFDLTWDLDKTDVDITADKNINSFSLTFSSNSPYFDSISGKFNIAGSFKECNVAGSLLTGSDEYSVAFSHSLKNTIMFNGSLETPFDGYKSMSASFEHSGSLRNFQCNGKFLLEDNDIVVKAKLDTSDLKNIQGNADIVSDYFDPVNFKIYWTDDSKAYRSGAELTVRGKKLFSIINMISAPRSKIDVIVSGTRHNILDLTKNTSGFKLTSEFKLPKGNSRLEVTLSSDQNITGSLSLTSPFLPTISARLDFSKKLTRFSSNLNFSSEANTDGSVILWWNLEDVLSTAFVVNIPILSSGEISGEFILQQSNKAFSIDSKLTNNFEKMFDFSFDLDLNRQFLNLELESTRPHPLTVEWQSSRSGPKLVAFIEVSHKEQKIINGNVDLTLKTRPVFIDGTSTIKSGKFEESASVYLDVEQQSLRTDASMKLNDKTWSFKANYNGKNDIDSNFMLNMPDRDEISGLFVQRKREGQSKTDAEFKYNKTHSFIYSMEVKRRNSIEGTVTLRTPFEGFRMNKLSFEHSGTFPVMTSSGEILLAEKEFSVSSSINTSKSSFSVKTPFDGFESLALSFYNEGDWTNFKAGGNLQYFTGEAIELDINHSLIGTNLKSMIRFMSPFTEEIVVTADHSGSPTSFRSDFGVSVGSGFKFTSQSTTRIDSYSYFMENDMIASMSGETYQQKLQVTHDGGFENFKNGIFVQSLGRIFRIGTSFQLQPVMTGSLDLTTPFENYRDIKASFAHSGNSNSILTTGVLQYAPTKTISGKIDMLQNGWRRMVASVQLDTPFDGMKMNKITYKHSGDSDSFQCDFDSVVIGKKFTGEIAASLVTQRLSIDVRTPFEGFETLGFTGSVKSNMGVYNGRMDAKWNPNSQIYMDGSLSIERPISVTMSVSTPFELVRQVSATFMERNDLQGNMESVNVVYNGKTLVDVDLELPPFDLSVDHKRAVFTVRSPRSMKYVIDGDFTKTCVEFNAIADWKSDNADNRVMIEGGYDFRTGNAANTPDFAGKLIKLIGTISANSSASNSIKRAGFSMRIGDYDGTVSLITPYRSLELSGMQRGQVTEGTFKWDADVDTSRRVTIKSVTVPASGVIKSDITITAPSIRKNIKISSELAMNQGRLLYSGKTELAYSGDSRKNIVLYSRLEDISAGSSQNYSFSAGLSHPYSTIGLSLNSHAGRSDTGYTAGLGLEYLTVKRQTKKFQIAGSIDMLRKLISFDLQSPVKSITISGSAQTQGTFRVSLLNVYDQRMQLSTVLTVDRKQRSLEFVTNYDLDQRSEFHVLARYVNSSAIAAEIFHMRDRTHVTDILATMRLNNSHLIHSRLHWRPELLDDLKEFIDRKSEDYNHRIHAAAERIEPEVVEELRQKIRLISSAIEEEVGSDNLYILSATVLPILRSGMQTAVSVSLPTIQQLNQLLPRSPANVKRAEKIVQQLQNPETRAKINNQFEILPSLRQTVTENVNILSDKLKLPSRHLPEYSRYLLRQAIPMVYAEQPSVALWGLDELVVSFIRDEILALEISAERFLRDAEKFILAYLKSPFTVYDPKHGEIQMELYSIVPLQSLDTLPILEVGKYAEKIKKIFDSVRSSIPSVPDFGDEWVPPFTGVATISRGHKITTFDGYIYDLENDCTYILSKDYTDGNFSLILSNNDYTTLTVLTTGKPISVSLNGDILLGGQVAGLPFQEGFVTVTRNEDNSVNIHGGDHFNINYDLNIDKIIIEVSGWYHGRTGGLLGIYDNEPSNDLMTSFNKVIDNVDRFARTWDVSSESCR